MEGKRASEIVREQHRRGEKRLGWGEGRMWGITHLVNPQLFTLSGVFTLSSEHELKSSHWSSNPRWNTVRCTVILGVWWKTNRQGRETYEWLTLRLCLHLPLSASSDPITSGQCRVCQITCLAWHFSMHISCDCYIRINSFQSANKVYCWLHSFPTSHLNEVIKCNFPNKVWELNVPWRNRLRVCHVWHVYHQWNAISVILCNSEIISELCVHTTVKYKGLTWLVQWWVIVTQWSCKQLVKYFSL